MIILEHEQRSEEWYKARCGIPTASEFDKIVTTKGEQSKSRKAYMYRLAGERITGKQEESYQNAAMQRGIELEPEAISFYEVVTDKQVQKCGFCVSEGKYQYGCSPDGLVGDDGGIELKCPIISTHVGYLIDNKLPTDYIQQVQGELFVTGREWWDFISYYPGMKPLLLRVERDEKFLKALSIELEIFCQELEETVKKIS